MIDILFTLLICVCVCGGDRSSSVQLLSGCVQITVGNQSQEGSQVVQWSLQKLF